MIAHISWLHTRGNHLISASSLTPQGIRSSSPTILACLQRSLLLWAFLNSVSMFILLSYHQILFLLPSSLPFGKMTTLHHACFSSLHLLIQQVFITNPLCDWGHHGIRSTERKKTNKNPLPLCSSCSTMEKLAIYKKRNST